MPQGPHRPEPPPPENPGGETPHELRRQIAQWRSIHRMNEAVSRARALDMIYQRALDGLQEALGVERASILLFDDDGAMRFKAWRGLSEGYRRAVEGHTPWSPLQSQAEPITVEDVTTDAELSSFRATILGEGIRALGFVPLLSRRGVIGKFMLYYAEPHRFTDLELELAQTLAGYVAFAVERQRTEDALKESDRRKDEFLAMLAHELRNPLAAIVNASELLRLKPDDPDVRGMATRMVDRQARHMARLVDDLLDVSRITRGAIPLQREPLDLTHLVRHAVEAHRGSLEQQGLHLAFSLPAEPVWIEGDEARLEQVAHNLLNNAAKFTPRGGAVSVELAGSASEAVLTVRDTGAGIGPDFLPRIFDLFTQADRSLARSQGGLGIGLTLSRAVVELHGGRIEAESEGVGKGSRFTIRLPQIPHQEWAKDKPLPAKAGKPAPLRVLVVEDNRDTARSLAELLRHWKHEAVIVPDGRGALSAARHFRPQVVLIDIGLPDMDGYELAQDLQREQPDLDARLIALTGFGHETDKKRSRAVGIAHHLVKPVDPAVLEDLLLQVGSQVAVES